MRPVRPGRPTGSGVLVLGVVGDNAPARLATWSDRQDLGRLGADTTGWRQIAADQYGIELVAPYLDNEVIRACLAVPADQRGAPGRYKPLLTTAFTESGVLPDFVLGRTTKGGFNALAYAGLRENAPVLLNLLGPSSRLAAAGLVTEQTVARMLKRAAAGQPTARGPCTSRFPPRCGCGSSRPPRRGGR